MERRRGVGNPSALSGDQRAPEGAASAREIRPPYAATAGVLLGVVVLSIVIPAAHQGFARTVPPLYAAWHPQIGWQVVLPVALIALGWAAAPGVLRSPAPLFLTAVVLFGWMLSVSTAVEAGSRSGLVAPLQFPADYYRSVQLVDRLGPREFARSYTRIYSHRLIHQATHPPGAPIVLWALSKLMRGSLVAVALAISLIGMLAALPAYALAREVYGESAARRAAILFVCAPGVILFTSTSSDALFMTAIVIAMAALVRAPRSTGWAVAAGLLISVALLMTYAALALAPIGIGFGLMSRRTTSGRTLLLRAVVVVASLVAGLIVIRVVVGVDLVSAFRSSLHAHLNFPATRDRPYAYWAWANIAAFLLSAGIPQTALLVAETRVRWRERRPGLETVLWAVVIAASVSGLFKGEVDHIWLFLIAPVAAVAAAAQRNIRGPAAGGAGQALGTEILLATYL